MPTARKLPSGSYRCQVFAGYEYVDGKKKRKYESFTAPTKREAERSASQWAASGRTRPDDITVKECVERYIASKENVLSASTIRGYSAITHRFHQIDDIKIRSLKSSDVQLWISGLAAKLKPKTVKNTYGLLTAALQLEDPDLHLDVTLPAKMMPDYYMPPDQDLQKVLSVCQDDLWIAVMLARYYSLRRSEICALDASDLNDNILTIRRVMVKDKNNRWHIKDRPKTYQSYRFLVLSDPVLSRIRKCSGRIIDCNPDKLTNRFRRAVEKAKVKPFTFHMLRHMFATKAAMSGIPDIFTAKMGGGNQNSTVLKSVYQNVRNDDLMDQMKKINASMQHEMQHENEKPL